MEALQGLRPESELVICEVVYAEVAPLFRTLDEFQDKLTLLGIEFDSIRPESAFLAGQMFRKYRDEGGPRSSLIPDFLIGAHALCQAGRLVSMDRGYLRRYFPKLRLVTIQP